MIVKSREEQIVQFLKHTSNSPLIRFNNSVKGTPMISLPICPKCEHTGLRDKGWMTHQTMTCPHCGYRGKATHVLSTYLQEGCYK